MQFQGFSSFKKIPLELATVKGLSFLAKGMLLQLWMLPAEWDFNICGFAAVSGCTKATINKYLAELISAGFVVRRKQKVGKAWEYTYQIRYKPAEDGVDDFESVGNDITPSTQEEGDTEPCTRPEVDEYGYRTEGLEDLPPVYDGLADAEPADCYADEVPIGDEWCQPEREPIYDEFLPWELTWMSREEERARSHFKPSQPQGDETTHTTTQKANTSDCGSSQGHSSGGVEKKPPQKRFTQPTVDEVKAYCVERGNGIDAEQFVDFYEARGWYIGKNKMKSWKAAVRTWERRDKEEGRNGIFGGANKPKRRESKPLPGEIAL
jgi:hypothetical protein